MTDYFESRGQWLYKLPDPYRQTHYLPIDAATMADQLGLSYRSALRVCKGDRALSKGELLALLVINYGYVPDPAFVRGRWYVLGGELRTHSVRDYAVPAGELLQIAVLSRHYQQLSADLAAARKRIDELTAPAAPSNVIPFPRR